MRELVPVLQAILKDKEFLAGGIFTKEKYYMEKYNLTQEQLSELSGISSDYLSEIERGKKTPSFKRLDLIANSLGIEVYKLFLPISTN